ncbi:TIGR02147 family protein [Bdellovibrio bacteriovorus]|uniref:TIGR02147 family protein n=1 Tax=Bdellovibrio bacteriovorus TaxID=959 RepID=UPI003D06A4C1
MIKDSVQSILSDAFRRKQSSHKGYSQRALARDLGVSAAFVTNVLNGKKMPPRDRLPSLIRILELDVFEQKALSKAMLMQSETSKTIRDFLSEELVLKSKERKAVGSSTNYHFLSKWWYIAVLEGLSLTGRQATPKYLQKRLGLTDLQFQEAITVLLREGLIDSTGTGYRKKTDHIYVPTGRSKKSIREFHNQMIQKAQEELKRASEEDFARRLISGFTFSLNAEQVNGLKAKIAEFMEEVSRAGSEANCDEVYQFNMQLFPLTQRK